MNLQYNHRRYRYSEIRGYETEQYLLLMLQWIGTGPNWSDVSNKCWSTYPQEWTRGTHWRLYVRTIYGKYVETNIRESVNMLKIIDWNMSQYIKQPSIRILDKRESEINNVNTLELCVKTYVIQK